MEDIRQVVSKCNVCAKIKPKFYRNKCNLIKATQPFERLSIDFKGPVPSVSSNKYFLTIVDEFSRFPFAFPCKDISSETVITCLMQLFSLFGMPSYIHYDHGRGASFMSQQVKEFLNSKGVAMSRSTPYNPAGNGQVERYNAYYLESNKVGFSFKRFTSSNVGT